MRKCLWCGKEVKSYQDFCCRAHCEKYEAEGKKERKEKALKQHEKTRAAWIKKNAG
jgi:hypothetical protein